MLKINNEKLMKNTGMEFETIEDAFFYVIRHLEWLESHNKNYTQNQYGRICDLKEIFESIEMDG